MPPRGGTVRLLRGSGPADEAEAGVFGLLARLHLARKVDSVFCVACWRLRASGRAEPSGVWRVEVLRLETFGR